jgi:hemerythrin superfamily protein
MRTITHSLSRPKKPRSRPTARSSRLLKDDHKTVERLFKQFEKAGDSAFVEKRRIVDRIIEELSVHASIEEQYFYPATRATVPETEDIALESLEEHHIVKWLLSELTDLDPTHERFDAKVTVLMENVRHHVEEEETEYFPMVRKELSRAALTDIGDAMANAKKSAPTKPHPRMPDDGPANVVTGALAGVADRVSDNVSGIAQGGVTALQDLIARITRSEKPKVSPTGSKATRSTANKVRKTASTATDGVEQTASTMKSGVSSTAKAAKSGAKGTATSAKRAARATTATAKRGATTTRHTASASARKTAATAKRSTKKTVAAAGAR